jgi:hypothetical protein
LLNLIIALLTIYNWLAVGLLILCLLLIARFYQKKSRQKSYYQIYLLPLGLFMATGFYYAWQSPELMGHPEADILRFLAGLILVITSYKLLMLMIGK